MALLFVFLQSQEDSEFRRTQEEVDRLGRQIGDLSQAGPSSIPFPHSRDVSPVKLGARPQENEVLRTSLLKARTNIAVLHLELDKLKNMYADQRAQHER